VGEPIEAEKAGYLSTVVDGVTVYYTPTVGVKQGFSHIRILLRKLLFWNWLELEGAKATTDIQE
jgi:hypothetical protein